MAYPKLLQLLPTPKGIWWDIIMDFMKGLQRSEGKDIIMVIVDMFIKYRHFIALPHPFLLQDIDHLFLNHFYKFHGLPVMIITDREIRSLKVFSKGNYF